MKRTSRFKTLRDYVNAQTSGKTQGDVARDLQLAQSTLSSYLSGDRTPSREIALRLSKQCGIPLENLLRSAEARG